MAATAVSELDVRTLLGDPIGRTPSPDRPEHVTEILVVDPDPATAAAVQAAFAAARVRHAPDAYCALDAVDSGRADVIVTELCLPGASAVELLQRLRRRGYGVPVVVLSHARGSAETLRALGVLAVLAKPASGEVLCATLQLACDRSVPDPCVVR